ncbi:MAG: hypothetical protein R3C28_14055 [Pirellulaceae bacterium]
MANVNLTQLVSKLNETCRNSLESAAGFCLSRTNYNVEIEHWLMKILERPNTDLTTIFKHFDVDQSRLIADLTKTIDGFKTGNARSPALSPALVEAMQNAWLYSSVEFTSHTVRTGHLLYALLTGRDPGNLYF